MIIDFAIDSVCHTQPKTPGAWNRDRLEVAIGITELRAMWHNLYVLTVVLPGAKRQIGSELERRCYSGQKEWNKLKRELEDRHGDGEDPTDEEEQQKEAIWRQFAVDWTLFRLLLGSEGSRRRFWGGWGNMRVDIEGDMVWGVVLFEEH